MIPFNEIRDGNYVTVNFSDHGKRVVRLKIHRYVIGFTKNENGEDREVQCLDVGDEFTEPIELDEDWLLKLGFERREYDDANGYSAYWVPGKGCTVFLHPTKNVCVHFFKGALYKHPQYVHQLQNAYFFLIGKELEYKQ